MNPASNLVLIGPMGAGKSSVGRRLAGRFGLAFVDLDHEIEERTGATVTTIFDCEGEDGFRARERAALAAVLERDGLVLATGGGAVLDAGNRALMRERGFVVHLHAGVERQLERLARDRSRPLLAGDDREDVLRRLADVREPLYCETADLRIDTETLEAAAAVSKLERLLRQCWQRSGAAHTGKPRAKSA